MNGVIELNDMVFHAYHGAFEQERIVGGTYRVSLKLYADYSHACDTDALTDTINYAAVCLAVNEEMAIPSNLIEHVAARIGKRLLDEFSALNFVRVRLCKQNPPINGMEVAEACFTCWYKRAQNEE